MKTKTPIWLFLFIVALTFHSNAGDIVPKPELLFVGDSGVCTYGSLQAALNDAPPNSEIRVTNEINAGELIENISITKNITIKGGYTNCGLAQLDSRADENRTLINGNSAGNVIKIDGDALVVSLSNFTLAAGVDEGIGPGRAHGGAVSIRGDDGNITFEQMTIANNSGRLGGGTYISGENNTITFRDTLFINNIAQSGGGIYCTSNGIGNIIINNNLDVFGNSASGSTENTGNGGGAFLSACSITQGGLTIKPGNILEVSGNQSNLSGGGMYVIDGSAVSATAIISNNSANLGPIGTGKGGGIYSHASTTLFSASVLTNNQAIGGQGGGLYAEDSNLTVSENAYNNCIKNQSLDCIVFSNNQADFGGAIYLSNSDYEVFATSLNHFTGLFYGNHAQFGSAIAITNDSRFSVQNAYFYNNLADDSVVFLTDFNTEVQFSHSTFANNESPTVFNVQSDASLDLINSIVNEPNETHLVLVNNLASVQTRCNIYHEDESVTIPFGSQSMVLDEPGFIDPVNHNYHLKPDSAAIDLCTKSGLETVHSDRDGDDRPIDIPDVGTGVGSYDAGADEYNDIIFMHGFED